MTCVWRVSHNEAVPEDIPPAPIPTIGTISRQLQGLAGQLQGVRNDIDEIRQRISTPPAPATSGAPAARPSLAVQAGKATLNLGKWTAVVLGALALAGQIAAQFKPGLVGPIQMAIQLIGGAQ